MARGSGRLSLSAAAAPDVSLIETTLAGGTVEREIIRAEPSAEGRTAAGQSAVESTKGWVWGAAGHGPGQTVPSVTAPCHKNDCDRTRISRTAIHTAAAGRADKTTNEPHPVPTPPGGGGRGALPPRPPEIYREGASLGEQNRNGTPWEASRLRSWLLSRRSGRVSASPCPPPRSSTILSALPPWNHSRCAPGPEKCAAQAPGRIGAVHSPRGYPQSNPPLRARYTRSWAVVFPPSARFRGEALLTANPGTYGASLPLAARTFGAEPKIQKLPAAPLDTTDSFREGHPHGWPHPRSTDAPSRRGFLKRRVLISLSLLIRAITRIPALPTAPRLLRSRRGASCETDSRQIFLGG